MKNKQIFTTREIALVGLFAALTAVFSQISIPIPPIPFSLGIFAVMLCASMLETKLAVAAQLIYVLTGAAGVPVFTGFQGGIQRLIGPTGGFLTGYILMSFTIGMILAKSPAPNFLRIFSANVAGIAVCYTFGALWLGISTGMPLEKVLAAAVTPFILPDLIKAAIASVAAQRLRVAVKALRTE